MKITTIQNFFILLNKWSNYSNDESMKADFRISENYYPTIEDRSNIARNHSLMSHISNYKEIYFKNKQPSYESSNSIEYIKHKNSAKIPENYNQDLQEFQKEKRKTHFHQNSMSIQKRIKYFSEPETSNIMSPSLKRRLSRLKPEGVAFFNMKTIEDKLRIMNDILPSTYDE